MAVDQIWIDNNILICVLGGLGGIGMGLGPGGQPISASQLNIGGVMGNLGPSGKYSDFIISFQMVHLLDCKAYTYSL